MDDLIWGAPFLAFLVPPIVRSVRWLRRSPRCPYCSALIRSGAVMCRRCEHRDVGATEVPFADLLDPSHQGDEQGDAPQRPTATPVEAGRATALPPIDVDHLRT
jgi:hypothetical protein